MGPLRPGAGRCRGPLAPHTPGGFVPAAISRWDCSDPRVGAAGEGARQGGGPGGISAPPKGWGRLHPGCRLGLASWPCCHRAQPNSPGAPSARRSSSELQARPPAEVPGVNNPGVCKQRGDNRAGRNSLWLAPSRRRPASGVPRRRSVPRRRGAATRGAGAEPPAPGGAGQRGAHGGTPTPWQGLGAAGPWARGCLGLSLPAALLV